MNSLFSSVPRLFPNLMRRFPLRGFAKSRRSIGTPYVLNSPLVYNMTTDYLTETEFLKGSLAIPALSGVLYYFDFKYASYFFLLSFVTVTMSRMWSRHTLKFIIKTIRYNPLDQLFTIETFRFPEPFLVKARQVEIVSPEAGDPVGDYTLRILSQDGDDLSSISLVLLAENLYQHVHNVEFFDALVDNQYDEMSKYKLSKSNSANN